METSKMSDYVTDPELLKKLNGEEGGKSEYVTDPELLKKLNSEQPVDEDKVIEEIAVTGAGAAAPYVVPRITSAAAATPGAVSGAYNQVAKPVMSGGWQAAKGLGGSYIKNPGGLAADVLASKMGLPPPVASQKVQPLYEGMNQSYQNVKDWMQQRANAAAQPKAPTGPVPNEVAVGQKLAQGMTAEELASAMQRNLTPEQIAAEQQAKGVGQPGTFRSLAQKYGPMVGRVGGAIGKALPAAAIAHELFYTSPEEIAILKRAEEERAAQQKSVMENYQAKQVLQAQPTSQNFFDRIQALGVLYGNK